MTGKRLAIIGGGITGLYLGYRLSQYHQVTIFEKRAQVGGLLTSFNLSSQSWPIENFYHHFFTSDRKVIKLLEELSIHYSFFQPQTAFWQNNRLNYFSTPKDLLLFPKLNLIDKLLLGGAIIVSKLIPSYRLIPKQEAEKLFPKLMGQKSYQAVWQPLMKGKFGDYHQQIAAVWLWSRIKKRSNRLGYPDGGFSQLVNRLAEAIVNQNGEIKTNQEISDIKQLTNFDQIIFTTPQKIFSQIAHEPAISCPQHLAALNLILVGERPILDSHLYWLNIADPEFPFVAIVNQSGLTGTKPYQGRYLTYFGGYYSPNNPLLKMSASQVLEHFTPFIKKINPNFKPEQYQAHLSCYQWSQPIVTQDYLKNIPQFATGRKNTYLVNMEQIYPWDRGINYALDIADRFLKKVALNKELS